MCSLPHFRGLRNTGGAPTGSYRNWEKWGISDVTYNSWAPKGKGWTLKDFSAMVTTPVPYPLIAFPAAWSPGLKVKEAEVVG